MVALPDRRSRSERGGFTLVELLVVMAIIVVLAGFTSVFVSGVVASMRLTQSTEAVLNILSQARRTALTRSHIVEVRFFQCSDPENPGSPTRWRGAQAIELLENGQEQPLGRAMVIPYRFIMSGTASTLFSTKTSYTGTNPGYLANITGYCHFRFMPDGSTDLNFRDPPPDNKWFVTLYSENDQAKGDPPPNYVTLQIESSTGAISVLRP